MGNAKFSVNNYEGITVSCTKEQWDIHIVGHHSIMQKNEKAVKDTIKDPDIVYESECNDNREIYFKASPYSTYKDFLTKVVVEYTPGKKNPESIVGEVVSAWPQKEEKGGISDVVYKRESKD